jgi:hypothetical protein
MYDAAPTARLRRRFPQQAWIRATSEGAVARGLFGRQMWRKIPDGRFWHFDAIGHLSVHFVVNRRGPICVTVRVIGPFSSTLIE